MFSIFLNFSLNTLLISVTTENEEAGNESLVRSASIKRTISPTIFVNRGTEKKKKKGSGEKKGKERKDRRRRCKSPDMVWYRGERRVARVQGPLRNDR